MSCNIFNFSFQIRCFRMDQDFSSLDLVRDHLKYCKWGTFYFFKVSHFCYSYIGHLWRTNLPDMQAWDMPWERKGTLIFQELIRDLSNDMQWEHLHDYDMIMPNFMCYATSSNFPKKSTPGKFTCIWHSHRKEVNAPKFEKNANWILEEVLKNKFAWQFSRSGKSLVNWDKVSKNGIELSFYYIFIYILKVSSSKCFTSEIGFVFGQILFNPPPPLHLQPILAHLPVLRSLSVTYLITLSLVPKRNYCFAKKSGISMKSNVFPAFAIIDAKAPSFSGTEVCSIN